MRRNRNISVKSRITASLLFLVLIPFLALFIIFYQTSSKYAYKMSLENQTNNLYSTQEQLDDACEIYRNLSLSVYYNGYVDSEGVFDEEKMEKALDDMSSTNSGIVSVIWEREDESYISGKRFVAQEALCSRYREKVRSGNGRVVWLPMEEIQPASGIRQSVLVAGRVIYTKTKEEAGILWMLLNGSMVKSIFNRTDFLDGSWNFLMMTDGTLVYSPREIVDQKTMAEIHKIYENHERTNAYTTAKIAGEKSLIVCQNSYDTKYVMVSVMPQSEILQDFQSIVIVFWVSMAVMLVFVVLIFRILRKQIFLPVENLTYGVDRFASGDLEIQLNNQVTGEMKKLTDHFNTMVRRVHRLMDEVKVEEKEKNEFKMQALMMQMSPHFIYNSLNTIKWIAVINKQENIRKLVESLIQIFMNMSKRSDENNTIRDEMEFLENYATIQKARFMNFDLIIEADEDTLSLKIRRFLLQPIVENAILHGLNQAGRSGWIRIRVYRDMELHIEIADNGVGFDVSQLEEKREEDSSHTRIGLENVQQMIHLEYGKPYGMTIESEPGVGTTVTYRLPVEE